MHVRNHFFSVRLIDSRKLSCSCNYGYQPCVDSISIKRVEAFFMDLYWNSDLLLPLGTERQLALGVHQGMHLGPKRFYDTAFNS